MQSREELIKTLQQADTPSIRLFALTRLKGFPEDHPQVAQEQSQVATQEPVISILNEQHPDGYWMWDHSHYTPKFKATHWTMQLLMELGLSGLHPAMQAGALYMRSRMQKSLLEQIRDNEAGFACFWGNFTKYQIHCGLVADATVQKTISLLVREIENDARCDWNYKLPCAWGLIRAMWGLAAISAEKRTPQVQHAIQHGLEFILERYSLVKADYPYRQKIHKSWFSLNFPLFYNTDILFTLRVLHELNALEHPSAKQALDWLGGKQRKSGLWRGASPDRRRTWAFTAGQDTVDHWATLHALTVFNEPFRLSNSQCYNQFYQDNG